MITILHKPESLFQSTENALTEALTAPKEEQARARPVFSLYISDGESVDFSPIRVCLIPYTRRLGKRSPHRGKRCLPMRVYVGHCMLKNSQRCAVRQTIVAPLRYVQRRCLGGLEAVSRAA